MRLDRSQQELNLCVFQHGFIEPALEVLRWGGEVTATKTPVHWARSALIECIDWLELGTTVGYYHHSRAVETLRTVIAHLSGRAGVEAFFNQWQYLFHPSTPPRVISIVTHGLKVESDQSDFTTDVLTLFRANLIRAMRFTGDNTDRKSTRLNS